MLHKIIAATSVDDLPLLEDPSISIEVEEKYLEESKILGPHPVYVKLVDDQKILFLILNNIDIGVGVIDNLGKVIYHNPKITETIRISRNKMHKTSFLDHAASDQMIAAYVQAKFPNAKWLHNIHNIESATGIYNNIGTDLNPGVILREFSRQLKNVFNPYELACKDDTWEFDDNGNVTKVGEIIWVLIHPRLIPGTKLDDNDMGYTFATLTDVTELKMAQLEAANAYYEQEQMLRQNQKLLREIQRQQLKLRELEFIDPTLGILKKSEAMNVMEQQLRYDKNQGVLLINIDNPAKTINPMTRRTIIDLIKAKITTQTRVDLTNYIVTDIQHTGDIFGKFTSNQFALMSTSHQDKPIKDARLGCKDLAVSIKSMVEHHNFEDIAKSGHNNFTVSVGGIMTSEIDQLPLPQVISKAQNMLRAKEVANSVIFYGDDAIGF